MNGQGPNQLGREFAGYAGAVALLGGLVLAAPATAQALAPWLFLATMLAFGLPHGATDLWVGPRFASTGPFLGGYLLWAGAAGVVGWLWPVGSFLGFLLLTIWHWGTGDFRRVEHSAAEWLVLGLSRGVCVIGGAISGDPATTQALATAVAGAPLPWLSPWAGRAFLVAGGLQLLGLWWWARRDPPAAGLAGLETLVICVAAWGLPAYASIGLYFSLVHSRRHLRRVHGLTPQGASDRPSRRWALTALGTALACAFLAASWLVVRGGGGLAEWTGRYFLLLQVLTWPHAALVVWLDWREEPRAAVG